MSIKKTRKWSKIDLEKLEKEVAEAKANYERIQIEHRKAKRQVSERETQMWSEQLIMKTLRFKNDLTIDEIVDALKIAVERKKATM